MIPGSGYIQKFEPSTKDSMLKVLTELKKQNWIDRQTRAVLLQFNLYSFQSNLFAAVTVCWEFLETAGGLADISIQFPNIRLLTSSYGYLLTLLEVILFMIYIVQTVLTVISVFSSHLRLKTDPC